MPILPASRPAASPSLPQAAPASAPLVEARARPRERGQLCHVAAAVLGRPTPAACAPAPGAAAAARRPANIPWPRLWPGRRDEAARALELAAAPWRALLPALAGSSGGSRPLWGPLLVPEPSPPQGGGERAALVPHLRASAPGAPSTCSVVVGYSAVRPAWERDPRPTLWVAASRAAQDGSRMLVFVQLVLGPRAGVGVDITTVPSLPLAQRPLYDVDDFLCPALDVDSLLFASPISPAGIDPERQARTLAFVDGLLAGRATPALPALVSEACWPHGARALLQQVGVQLEAENTQLALRCDYRLATAAELQALAARACP